MILEGYEQQGTKMTTRICKKEDVKVIMRKGDEKRIDCAKNCQRGEEAKRILSPRLKVYTVRYARSLTVRCQRQRPEQG